ncbi:uncharacterized protein SPAPADRAFT_63499 [Spathaspora passalidarum NRRL Y-27907]|uniref:Maintenance of telomere capping protein 1 n=1 Tax=Spathaspora passalidarum (strain NRRL Y-27907 / 11-Y1) TaxID=619300 RepID=G3AV75_SPAPN|nr:uncharacterized protein SPAPADRAFT_63499 [Spathaspora passalidarum NRRL Y-27907]EGW29878.1 hypothetical protein SPAPADRAFT_63499 [Spathaspora passalidarum NRRL Y-27907]
MPTDKDVLDFINSLPDSKPSTPQPVSGRGSSEVKESKADDLLDFLDELAQHETTKRPASRTKLEPKKDIEPKKSAAAPTTISSSIPLPPTVEEAKESTTEATTATSSDTTMTDEADTEPNAQAELEIDPIGQISSWWSKEGSTKVSSLWGTITSNAEKLSEQTYQLASATTNQLSQQRQHLEGNEQLSKLSDRLNSLVVNVSNQIKQGLLEDVDEILNVMIVCDLYNLNYLNRLVSENFQSVMNQVEGGINVSVVQFNQHHDEQETNGVKLNMFYGKVIDGEKLCFANLESAARDFQKIEPSPEEKQQQEEELINKSNIFISIQPITTSKPDRENEPAEDDDKPVLIESSNANSFSFTIVLKDITNGITIITKTQPFPLRWAAWLDGEELNVVNDQESLTDSVDPREWVKDWIKQGLNLSLGVVAQEYVIKRMGV